MQAIILAAGTGSRLRPLTDTVPKCMVKVNGIPMIERTIDALVAAGIKKLIIGLGYKSEVLKDFIRRTFDEKRLNGMQIEFGENPDYDKTNNIYSLYLLKEFFKADDTLLIESDLVYKPEVLKDLVNAEDKNLAVVSRWEDWMDGTVTLLNEDDEITNFIVKKNQKNEEKSSYYKTVNIYKFSKEFTNTYYLPFLETFMNVFGKNSYYETCLKFISETDSSLLKGFKIDQGIWYEVDNQEDLKEAEKRF